MLEFLQYACLSAAIGALLYQMTSCALALARCHLGKSHHPPSARPPITVVRPLRGLEAHSRETIGSTFAIDYPDYEILFCVADREDPVIPLVHAIIAECPQRDASILIGLDRLGDNPKLNNMAKGFHAARFEHIVFVDSNVFTPAGYLDQLIGKLEHGAGMVSAPPVGLAPDGFWAELECAFLNSYQARIQYAVDCLGMGFAQGKTLFFRKADLENGGLARLASEPAEDAAATKMIRAKGRRIRLAGPFPQLIGRRSFSQVWQRQVRWARLRRASFPACYLPEVFAGALPPLAAFGMGVNALGLPPLPGALAFMALWYLPELVLCRVSGWPRSLLALLLRDLLLPVIFVAGAIGSQFEWHGHRMTTAKSSGQEATALARLRQRLRQRPLWSR